MLQSFVGNFAVVALFISGWAHARDWVFKTKLRVRRLIFGAFMGAGAVASMAMAIQFEPGILFDLRSSLLVIAALFGGPVSALVTTAMAVAYRLGVGGAGAYAGIFAMSLACGAGIVLFYLSPNNEPRWRHVLLAAGAQSIATLGTIALLPADVVARTVFGILPAIVLAAFLATALAGFVLMETRRRAQERDLLVAALAQSPDFTYVKNRNSQFAAVNQAVAEHHGFGRPAELVGKSDADLEDAERAATLLAGERDVLAGREMRDVEELVTDVSGRARWFVTSKVPLRNADGRILGLAGVTRDVTADKQINADLIAARRVAEAAAAQSRTMSHLLVTTLEAMDQGLILVRPDDTMPLYNRRAAELLDVPWSFVSGGPTHGELVAFQTARGDFDGLPEAVIADIANPLGQAENFEAAQRTGKVLETRTRHLSDGAIVRTFTDITARKATELQLQEALSAAEKAQRMAEAASLAKTEFLSTMSHEIRTPLNAIIGFTHLALDEDGVPPPALRKLELIRGAGEMLLTVVNDVLDFSRIEAGEIMIDDHPLSLPAMVACVIATLQASAESKGLTLTYTLDETLPHWLSGDEARLRQILLNLINNAIKFTAAGSVAVSVSRGAAASSGGVPLRFEVTDTGIGIAPEMVGGLFKRFAQVDSSITRRFGGSGLGLAITKQLVELMDGKVGVESVVGAGSTFWFEVGLRPSQAPAAPAPALGGGTAKGFGILLADDLPLNGEIAATILRRAGHTVDVVTDGAQAVASAGARAYDLILMDVQMPGMDGLAATRAIRSLSDMHRAVPIVAMTANVLPSQIEAFAQAGMNDHLGKPYKPDQVLALIDKWLVGDKPTAAQAAPTDLRGDDATLAELTDMVGENRVATFLETLLSGLSALNDVRGDTRAMAGQAHMLVSQAGMLGFMDLSKVCSELEQACTMEQDTGEAVETIAAWRGVVARRLSSMLASGQKSTPATALASGVAG